MKLTDFYKKTSKRADTCGLHINAAGVSRVLSEAFLELASYPVEEVFDLIHQGIMIAKSKTPEKGIPTAGVLAILFCLLFAGSAPAQPRLGEAVYDECGNLVHADPFDPGCIDCIRFKNPAEKKAFLVWIWNRRNPNEQQRPSDPQLLLALQQLQANQQRLIELVAAMQQQMINQQRLAPQQPQIIVLGPGSQPYQKLDPEPKPRQELKPEPKPRQDLTPEPRPRQELDPEPKPRQDLNPDSKPRQNLTPGEGKPLTEPPGRHKGPPTGYQTYTRSRPVPIVRAVYPIHP